jgi:arylsulfatase A-like enzyme
MQGINVLDNKALSGRDAIFAENHKHDFSSIDSSLLHRIIIDRNWKLILPGPINLPEAGPELYDLRKDPFEWRNLSEDHPEKVEELSWKLEEWWR